MNFKCAAAEEITVSLENRPGVLADLCAHLADHRISIRAISAIDGPDTGGARLVVDQPESAKGVLARAGVTYTSTKCLALEMPNNPGGFAGIARILSLAGINIDCIYASALPEAGKALGIFHVPDVERALKLCWDSP
jgi:hypothetical protein